MFFANAKARSRTGNISRGQGPRRDHRHRHTRWATHGFRTTPTPRLCPLNRIGDIALISNAAFIENYRVRRRVIRNSCTFRSSTDSEVLVNLIEYVRETERLFAVRSRAAGAPSGGQGLCHRRRRKATPTGSIAARQSSLAMVVGISKGEYFLSRRTPRRSSLSTPRFRLHRRRGDRRDRTRQTPESRDAGQPTRGRSTSQAPARSAAREGQLSPFMVFQEITNNPRHRGLHPRTYQSRHSPGETLW